MELIGKIWSFVIEIGSIISSKEVFVIAAPSCLLIERSIQYYYTVKAAYESADDRRTALVKYLKTTVLMMACTALLFVWVFDDFEIGKKMLLIGASIWYFYTILLAYYFVGDYINSRK